MECKFKKQVLYSFALPRINRYIMECKYCTALALRTLLRELIDTLWNVNSDTTRFIQINKKELIDTLWNVNLINVSLNNACAA